MKYSKDLYDYLFKVYEIEKNRIKNIEEKAKYVFSINSLILIGIFFKYKDVIESLNILECNIRAICVVFLIISFTFLMVSFFITLSIIKVRRLKGIYPDNLVDTIFNPESKFFESDTTECFYDSLSKHVAISIEYNRKIIGLKNKRVRFSLFCVILGFFGVALFLSTIIIYG